MLGRYTFFLYLRVFLVVSLVLLGIVSAYALMDVILVFKDKDPYVAFQYLKSLIPIAFLYLSPFISAVSLFIVLRYLFSKRIDLVVQSFGISPLRLFISMITFWTFLSLFNLVLSFDFYPRLEKGLYLVEKQFKKKKDVEELILRNVWFFKEEQKEKIYINFQVVSIKEGKVFGVFLVRANEDELSEVIQGEKGSWQGDTILIPSARFWNFKEGKEGTTDIKLTLFDISKAKPVGEKVEHLSIKDLLVLYSLGKSVGLNENIYLSEVIRRFLQTLSLLPISVVVLSFAVRKRSIIFGIIAFTLAFIFYWLSFISVKLISENTSLNPSYGLIFYLPLLFLFLKGLYDLREGFRV